MIIKVTLKNVFACTHLFERACIPLVLHTIQNLLASSCGLHRSASSPTKKSQDFQQDIRDHGFSPASHLLSYSIQSTVGFTGLRSL